MKKQLPIWSVYLITCLAMLLFCQWGSRAVTVLSESRPISRRCRIVIDAGHGGIDGGAESCTGMAESSYNLSIALRLRDLMHLIGYETTMIRTGDVSVYTNGETIAQKKASDLKERIRIVNETENGLLLSIHQNFFPDSRYRGAQVFYAETDGSGDLAQYIQAACNCHLGSTRQCKKSQGVYLMEHIRVPGVLIECGFLSNREEEALLRSARYQKKLCCVLTAGLVQYLSNT